MLPTQGITEQLKEWKVFPKQMMIQSAVQLAVGAAYGNFVLGIRDPVGMALAGVGNVGAYHLAEWVTVDTNIIPAFNRPHKDFKKYRMGGIFLSGVFLGFGLLKLYSVGSLMYGAQALAANEASFKVAWGFNKEIY